MTRYEGRQMKKKQTDKKAHRYTDRQTDREMVITDHDKVESYDVKLRHLTSDM